MKLSGNHSSLIDLSQNLVKFLNLRHPNLKVSPGIITSKRSARSRNQKIKVAVMISGLNVTVTQNATIQKLRIYETDKDSLQALIKQFCVEHDIQFVNS